VVSTFNLNVKPSRAFIPVIFGLFAIYSSCIRRVYGICFRRRCAGRALLILGNKEEAGSFYRSYTESGFGWSLEFVDPVGGAARTRVDGEGSPVIDTDVMAKLADGMDRYAAVVLACDPPRLQSSVLLRLIKMHASNVPVITKEAFHELRWDRVSIDSVGPKWIFDHEFRLAHDSAYSYLKRLLDILVAVTALAVLIPVLVIIGWSIRLESPGPALFRQRRVGRDGRVFAMLKFRTMYSSGNGDIYTRQDDQRVTPFGHWLRRARLDELPQLWNVLIGDMSLIGPRAEWVKCAEVYEEEICLYHLRHLVKPGITGWAQVKFRYGESKNDAIIKFEYDLYYIRHFSLHMDVTIILKTLHTMVCGKGR
jgi:exopolysaccharide biosynthesis polyprenyl glycosylphosphotransferase